MKAMEVNVEISARHVHLTKEDFAALFGADAVLNRVRDLSVIGEFQSDKRVTLVGPKSEMKNVAVVGPLRAYSQVEIARTDAFALGVKNVPLRLSADLAGSAAIKVVGERGSLDLPAGLIVAKRHLHISAPDAAKHKLKDNDEINLRVGGERGAVLGNITVRVSNILLPTVHLDTDEGNAIGGAASGVID